MAAWPRPFDAGGLMGLGDIVMVASVHEALERGALVAKPMFGAHRERSRLGRRSGCRGFAVGPSRPAAPGRLWP